MINDTNKEFITNEIVKQEPDFTLSCYNSENAIDFELKDKVINEMKWKPISKYNRKEYDWVLVKYFDGDYECVPDVAEKRSDDRWYNSSGEIIPFEVKYFFDMQMLDYFTKKVGGRNKGGKE